MAPGPHRAPHSEARFRRVAVLRTVECPGYCRMTSSLRWLLLGLVITAAGPLGVAGASGSVSMLRQVAQVADSSFRHEVHEDFGCLDCHTLGAGHGSLLVRNVDDCRACHHVAQQVNRVCADCHEAPEIEAVAYPQVQEVTLSVAVSSETRVLEFSHAPHRERECAECHVGGPSLAVPELDCQRCHEEHHLEGSTACMTCHQTAPEGAHPLEVHETCSGSGCHVDPPFEASPRTRIGCMWCHEDKADHEPQDNCVECHFLSVTEGEPRDVESPAPPTRVRPIRAGVAALLNAFRPPYLRATISSR
jgi:hypothetical protein